jgi:hypothetical protein
MLTIAWCFLEKERGCGLYGPLFTGCDSISEIAFSGSYLL